MTSCFQESLCDTNHGRISISNCGRRFLISYNNINLIHDLDAYLDFYKNVEHCHEAVKNDPKQEDRNVVFATKVECMRLTFSPIEIKELYYLMQSALIEYKVHA